MAKVPTQQDNGKHSAKPLADNLDSLLCLAPDAIRVLRDLLGSDSDRVRLDASKALLDRAGLLPSAERRPSSGATLSEMPIADLRRIADALEGELSARATPVKPAAVANKDAKRLAKTNDILA